MSESRIPGLIEDLRHQIAEAREQADLAVSIARKADCGRELLGLMLAMKASGEVAHYRCNDRTLLSTPKCLACFLDENTVLVDRTTFDRDAEAS